MTFDVDLTIGLDISSAVTGYAVLRDDGSLLELGHVNTKNVDELWDAADAIRHRISKLNCNRTYAHLFVEEDLRRLRNGMSNAQTINTLTKINGIVTYMARTAFNVKHVYIQATKARSECGLTIVKPKTAKEKKDPRFVKQQVFDQMLLKHADLRALQWPLTRPSKVNPGGRLRDENFDMVDAYVIAYAGWLRTHTNGVS